MGEAPEGLMPIASRGAIPTTTQPMRKRRRPVRHSIFRRGCMCEFYVAKSEPWFVRVQRLGKVIGVAHRIFGKNPTP